MIQETLLYHAVTIRLFLFLLVINLVISWLFGKELKREIKATRITFFLFSALLSMVAFTGVVLAVIADVSWNKGTSLMVVALVLLSGIEIARSRRLGSLWIVGRSGISWSWRYVLAEMAIVLAVMLYRMADTKDAIPLP